YVPRPPNAFMCYRSHLLLEHRSPTHGAGGFSVVGTLQQDISREAGSKWRAMSEEERRPFMELAAQLKAQHAILYP
ncbi:hypothetical protein C8J57DRAFT_994447, partial [Mycena rebaudengoi]